MSQRVAAIIFKDSDLPQGSGHVLAYVLMNGAPDGKLAIEQVVGEGYVFNGKENGGQRFTIPRRHLDVQPVDPSAYSTFLVWPREFLLKKTPQNDYSLAKPPLVFPNGDVTNNGTTIEVKLTGAPDNEFQVTLVAQKVNAATEPFIDGPKAVKLTATTAIQPFALPSTGTYHLLVFVSGFALLEKVLTV